MAGMLTLRHGDTLVYKYGCSNRSFNNLGGMHLLYWQAIQEAKAAGLRRFDFGRTDIDQQGLITFKKRWGGVESGHRDLLALQQVQDFDPLLRSARGQLEGQNGTVFDVASALPHRCQNWRTAIPPCGLKTGKRSLHFLP